MNLRRILLLPISIILASAFSSCDDKDDVVNISNNLSKDAQIYSFTIEGSSPENKIDSLAYPKLEKTVFSIDQYKSLIYNADSLPYKMTLASFIPKMTFSKGYVSEVKIHHSTDSVKNWLEGDSINFSTARMIEVYSADHSISKLYKIEFRIHKIDPDTLMWKSFASLPYIVKKQKTLPKGNDYLNIHLDGSQVYTAEFAPASDTWSTRVNTTLPVNTILSSATNHKGKFFIVDADGFAYSSNDGATWTKETNSNGYKVYNILGLLPNEDKDLDDSVLTIVEDAGQYLYATTSDFTSFTLSKVNGNPTANESVVKKQFLAKEFSSVTLYDEDDRRLLLTGGTDFTNTLSNQTWSLKHNKGKLEVALASIIPNGMIDAQDGIPTFVCDEKLYAVNDSVLCISKNMGGYWRDAPVKQALAKTMPKTMGQSVIVDNKNYIWVFGGMPDKKTEVWRGRLNRLGTKD